MVPTKLLDVNAERVTRATSDKSRLAVKSVKTELRRHFFSQRVVEGRNKLPAATRDAKSVNKEKKSAGTDINFSFDYFEN